MTSAYNKKSLLLQRPYLSSTLGTLHYEEIRETVVNSQKVRGKGVGKVLMQKSIEWMNQLFAAEPVKIGAQTYLLDFYTSLGFVSTGEEYLEDNIPHTVMILKR